MFQSYQQLTQTDFLITEAHKINSLTQKEAQENYAEILESIDGLSFFPINSWPTHLQDLLQQDQFGDTDTFKFLLFAHGNAMAPHLLSHVLLHKYKSNPSKLMKRIRQIRWIINSIPHKSSIWYYFDIAQQKYLLLNGSPKPSSFPP